MRATIPQLRSLRDEDPVLYNYAVHPIAELVEEGVAEIDLGKIKDVAHRKLLVDWARSAGIQIHDAEYPGCKCRDCSDKRIAEYAEAKSQEVATEKRLAEYFRAGLLDNAHNVAKLDEFLNAKFPNLKVVTPAHIDAFVSSQRNELQWAPKPVAPAPPPAPPKVFLADGSEQKPLDEQPNPSWTLAQLRDWSKRDQARKNPTAAAPGLGTLPDGSAQKPLTEQPNRTWTIWQAKDWSARSDEARWRKETR